MKSNQQAKQDSEKLRELHDGRRHQGPVMVVAPKEIWSLLHRCGICKKPILFSGKCYACGSGRTRTYRRPLDERGEE